MFALLAIAGDMGGAFGPSMVGYFSQQAGDNLQAGLLMGCIFPFIMLVTLIVMRKMEKKDKYCGCQREGGGLWIKTLPSKNAQLAEKKTLLRNRSRAKNVHCTFFLS